MVYNSKFRLLYVPRAAGVPLFGAWITQSNPKPAWRYVITRREQMPACVEIVFPGLNQNVDKPRHEATLLLPRNAQLVTTNVEVSSYCTDSPPSRFTLQTETTTITYRVPRSLQGSIQLPPSHLQGRRLRCNRRGCQCSFRWLAKNRARSIALPGSRCHQSYWSAPSRPCISEPRTGHQRNTLRTY